MQPKADQPRDKTQRVDMHVHTVYSYDGYLTLEAMDQACRRRGVTAVVVADHNEVVGALQAKAMHADGKLGTRIIVAEEVSTTQGEIIGLFLEEKIPRGLSVAETIQAIRSQGGLVYLNHPFGYSMRSAQPPIEALDGLWDQVDIVEVFNGRNLAQQANALALQLAGAHGKPGGVGTDAHSAWEVGRSFVTLADFDGPDEFLAALGGATRTCRPCPASYRAVFKARKMLWRRPCPDNSRPLEGD